GPGRRPPLAVGGLDRQGHTLPERPHAASTTRDSTLRSPSCAPASRSVGIHVANNSRLRAGAVRHYRSSVNTAPNTGASEQYFSYWSVRRKTFCAWRLHFTIG